MAIVLASSGLGKNSKAPRKAARGRTSQHKSGELERSWPCQEQSGQGREQRQRWAPASSHGSPQLGKELGCVASLSYAPNGRQGCRVGIRFRVTLGRVLYQLLVTLYVATAYNPERRLTNGGSQPCWNSKILPTATISTSQRKNK